MKDLIIRPERCMSCHSCEIACVVSHSKSKNIFSAIREDPAPGKRISVELLPALGASMPVTCRHCKDASCVSVCPTKALTQDTDTEAVIRNLERCVDCWTCSTVCTRFSSLYQLILATGCRNSSMLCNYKIIDSRTENGTVIKCDFCDGRELPACVEACPTHALAFAEVERR
ncbi:CO dehydrogenase iron-sulfur protein CooF [Methanosarcina siciliae C2J]|uniref:CO dehydrogenase iron-sulfur protein CooF n=1 Tax=Methanosarcina siciliae C2J TaxID=1434118 RepID=A0A0E3PLM6_9EURY|nr:4Fe-4S dicluster domain-containing protein [Methanosarcina siciliae]AKB36227.1 CO dehydrogenase iron-sulfur protein CooF [Methanosarcina siciliae C2J]